MSSYTHKDILAIASLIPNISQEALTNDDLNYWYTQLKLVKKT